MQSQRAWQLVERFLCQVVLGLNHPGLLKGPIDSAIYAENWDRFAVRGKN